MRTGGLACRLMCTRPTPSCLVAADFSSTAVSTRWAFAASQALEGIRWEVGDAQTLAHPDATFDTVISCETIEHLPRLESARALRWFALHALVVAETPLQ